MSWEEFGSPYDPNHRGKGKITRPQAQQQRQHQVRGCGDPSCPFCNPETAALGAPARGGRVDPRNNSPFGGSGFSMEEVLRGVMAEALTIRLSSGAPEERKDSGDAAYQKARKPIEQWIIAAPAQAFDDIIGNDAALDQLRDAIRAPVTHKALYEAYGMKMPRGALLSGPPGCGKTMFARAAASEMKALYGDTTEFISVSTADLQSMFVGETEGRIKAIFTFARAYRKRHGHPLLVFIDEAEVLLPDRTGRVRRVASWEESQVATFLAEMDGIEESGAFVLLATNRPDAIDQAVLRDGRCDFKIAVARPTQAAVETILQRAFAGVPVAKTASLEALVFAAVECLYDPQKIIIDARQVMLMIRARIDGDGNVGIESQAVEVDHKHFLLEHIVSGAMAASIPARAKRNAFARDKVDGVARGVTVEDVVRAVGDIFEENRRLDHAFAFEEFKRDVVKDAARPGFSPVAGGGRDGRSNGTVTA